MSNIQTMDDIVSEAMGLVAKLKKQLMKANRECPECTGNNLNEENTICWDCSARDYAGD